MARRHGFLRSRRVALLVPQACGLLSLGRMGSVDWQNLWTYVTELEERVTRPEVVPHEETDLHRVFCDEHFCLERGVLLVEE